MTSRSEPTTPLRMPAGPIAEADALVVLHAADDVAIAKRPLVPGTRVARAGGAELVAGQLVPSGHKVAIAGIAAGAPVRRYGQIIGFATRPIRAGDHVHEHNLSVGDFERDYAVGADYQPVELVVP